MTEHVLPASPFFFVRHGETDWNSAGRLQGRSDIPLNAKGLEQAAAAARQLAHEQAECIVTSPLERARQTAEAIRAATLLPLHTEPDLTECDFSPLEGTSISTRMKLAGITRKDELPQILPADGESWGKVKARALRAVHRWSARTEAPVIFVGHDAVLQALSETLTGTWFNAEHGQPYRFTRAGRNWSATPLGG